MENGSKLNTMSFVATSTIQYIIKNCMKTMIDSKGHMYTHYSGTWTPLDPKMCPD